MFGCCLQCSLSHLCHPLMSLQRGAHVPPSGLLTASTHTPGLSLWLSYGWGLLAAAGAANTQLASCLAPLARAGACPCRQRRSARRQIFFSSCMAEVRNQCGFLCNWSLYLTSPAALRIPCCTLGICCRQELQLTGHSQQQLEEPAARGSIAFELAIRKLVLPAA